MNRLKRTASTLRSGFERQFQEPGATSLLVGLACNLAFAGQIYFWPALWHTSVFRASYTDATYAAELACAVLLGLWLRRTGRVAPKPAVLVASAALVQATLVLYCVLFELGAEVPDALNWFCGAVFGMYLPLAMGAWLELHIGLRAERVVWNIMLAAVFASFVIWVFSGLSGVKICVCMGVLLLIATGVLVGKLARARASQPEARLERPESRFRYPASATFLFSFAFITAISFAGIEGESASFATGAFFAPMLAVCVIALLANNSAFPLSTIAVPAIVMGAIATSSLHFDPAISFDLAALGMFLFLAYAVLLICAGLPHERQRACQAFLKLMAAFSLGCIAGRTCMALCYLFAERFASDILVLLSILTANAAMIILIRRGLAQRRPEGIDESVASPEGAKGRGFPDQALVDRVAAQRNLGEREKEVLELLLAGASASEVARRLVIANGTAKSHIRHVYGKLGVHSREELFDLFGAARKDAGRRQGT